MFNKVRHSITLDDILKIVSEYDILAYYLGITTIPTIINSPLRQDNTPSFSILYNSQGRVIYHDFANNDKGGIIDLLMAYFQLSFIDTLSTIYNDIPSMKKYKTPIRGYKLRHTKVYRKSSKLECKVRNWEKHDFEYWSQYGISKEWLLFGRVYPISNIIITYDDTKMTFSADKYAYCYVENKDNKISIKTYQPYNKKYKWANNHDSSVWDLWEQLPKSGDKLIITSSRKDALCIWANTGIPSCSLQAESYTPKKQVVDELKSRFSHIYILYDNDIQSTVNHGRLLGKSLSELFDLQQIEIPDEYKSKDSSDLYKNHGREILRKVIFSLTKT